MNRVRTADGRDVDLGRALAVLDDMLAPAPASAGTFGSKLEELAAVMDAIDLARGVTDETEMQDDLRRWARELRGAGL